MYVHPSASQGCYLAAPSPAHAARTGSLRSGLGANHWPDPEPFRDSSSIFRLKELPGENHKRKTKKTKKVYESNLKNHIIPKWGSYQIRDIFAAEVEEWLERLSLAPGSRAKIRNQMSAIFRHGIRWGWIGEKENPITTMRTSSKRLSVPETLTAEEFLTLYGRLPDGSGRWSRSAQQLGCG